MKLTITKKGTKSFQYFLIKDGDEEFCTTHSLDIANLITDTFNVKEVQTIKKYQSLDDILFHVFTITGVDLRTNLSQTRTISNVRFIFCKIATDNGFTQELIGLLIKRDHASICNAAKKCQNYIDTDKNFRELYHKILNE